MPLLLIGQALESASARHVRIEVLVDRPPSKSGATPTIFVTKCADGQIGERSIAMSGDVARAVAALLCAAADS
jgi:hypothetical protein